MAPGMKSQKKYLDNQHCFETWVKCGSIPKTVRLLVSEGIVNPKTGKSPTDMGVWGSAWMYIFDNLVETKPIMYSWWRREGVTLSNEELNVLWSTQVVKEARYLLTPSRYNEFIEKNSYLKPYIRK